MTAAVRLAPRRRVAFQGAPGAFGEDAIAALWPGDALPVPMTTVADVVRAAALGEVDAGIVPVENLIAGTIDASREALAAHPGVHVVGAVTVPVRQCLLAPRGATLPALETVESHAVALAQCGRFLARHPHLRPRASWDTAGAARDVAAAGDPRRAAIAGRAAAERYGLVVLADGIEDRAGNRTRFVAVARDPGPHEELARLRARIDRVDDDLVRLVGERLRLARRIGAVKRAAGLAVRDEAREADVLRRVGARARARGVPAEHVRRMFVRLLRLSREAQRPTE